MDGHVAPAGRERSKTFLDRIVGHQTDERRSTNETMAKVLNVHLPTAYDKSLDEQISWLLDSIVRELGGQPGVPARGPIRGGQAVVVTGEAGAGKSSAVSHSLRTRPEFDGFGKDGGWSPVLSVVAPSPFTLGALGNEIVRKLGYAGRREIQHSKVWPVVREMMADRGVRILHIDEAQHGDEIVGATMTKVVENTFKRMMQDSEWLVWLILSGLPELARFCQNDASMKRRVRIVRFEPLRFPDHVVTVRDTIRRIGEACPSVDCRSLLTDEFAHRLLHAAMNQFGIMVEYVQDAIGECLTAGDTVLTVGHFADVYSVRTGEMQDELNVFVARQWTSISVESALYEEAADEAGKPLGGRKLKGRHTKGRS